MIAIVPKNINTDVHKLGEPAATLLRIAEGGVRTIPSIVISKALFEAFMIDPESRNPVFKKMLIEILDYVNGQLQSYVDIRACFEKSPPGFPEFTRIRNTRKSVKRTILDIFSTCSNERFRAFWIVNDLSGPCTFPTLLIQNHVGHEFYLVSREPKTGGRTTTTNFGSNVHNNVKVFRSAHARLLRRVEASAGFPVKVIFTETPNQQVCRVEQETMTTRGWLSALSSMRRGGFLDNVRTLLLIQPEMIAQVGGSRIIWEPDTVIASGSGLPASKGCATGRILMPHDPLPTDRTPFIFVCREQTPEDIPHVQACQGGVGARGGMTSHLAVTLRGTGKPGVTGAGDLVVKRQSVTVGDINIPKHAFVYVDGNRGRYAFSLTPFSFSIVPYYQPGTDQAILHSMMADLQSIKQNQEYFASLPVADQLHLASLINAFRNIGMEMS